MMYVLPMNSFPFLLSLGGSVHRAQIYTAVRMGITNSNLTLE